MTKIMKTIDANEACAYVSHKLNEVIAIYPITPTSPIGEWAEQWSVEGRRNIFGTIPDVVELQSEAGAAGAVHGALQTGALTTTFTASQGLLLMIPNMYKIAGELSSTVFHIASRSIAAQGLSIFGDHGDVMAARQTGFAQLFAASGQEVHDFSLISTVATLKSRVPFLHIFDGFRTSHEISKLQLLDDSVMETMVTSELVQAHRDRALSPDRPVMRGTAQNPDVYFQARESVNPYYLATPAIVQETMDEFAALTGRQYKLFDYSGAPDAERIIILMGSGAGAVQETIEKLNAQGEKVGLLQIRLFRPFDISGFIDALPKTLRSIAVLDRTKEPGSTGEPLYQDVVTAVVEAVSGGTAPFSQMPKMIGGRYGLSSKEFTPAMVKAIYDELTKAKPKTHFTIGIYDDVTHLSLDWDSSFRIDEPGVISGVFYGLGSDGTVGANKNSIKIIGENTDNFAQAYFVYDSKKAGAVTISHLRFGPNPIRSTYLIQDANFVACHQFSFLERYDVLRLAAQGATFLLNSPYSAETVWDYLPRTMQETIIDKELHFFVVDAVKVARETKMGRRINTILQTCFFALSGILPRDKAIEEIKTAIEKTYSKRGAAIIQSNFAAVDMALSHLAEVSVPAVASSNFERRPIVPEYAPEFVQSVTARMIEGVGDLLPVSALPADGTYMSGTTQYEKRNIADEIPVWDTDLCIQCGKCVFVCPHAVIRQKVFDPETLEIAPAAFKSTPAKFKEFAGWDYALQVAPEDCTGCRLCVEACPVSDKTQDNYKAINMRPQAPLREVEAENWDYFLTIPHVDRTLIKPGQIKYNQLLEPLFEFSGACAGCGETPYLKLMTQLFGDRTYVANATGCSSIYGGNLPTTPWTTNEEGRGPAWSNSLFEDNAEFGLGMRVALDMRHNAGMEIVNMYRAELGEELADSLINADQSDEAGIQAQRQRVQQLQEKLVEIMMDSAESSIQLKNLLSISDDLVKKSVWIVGGDGWAYDIGYGGLDHVLASGRNVNILVMDTEVYSNTGGQNSKATPRAAVAKFAAGGKGQQKKDLAMMAMHYRDVYVAKISFGANDRQTVTAFVEAEAHDGPSLIIAYSTCIAHGYDISDGIEHMKNATDSGYWPLYRWNPEGMRNGKKLKIDSRRKDLKLKDWVYKEARFRQLLKKDPVAAERLLKLAEGDVDAQWEQLQGLKDETV